MKKFRATWMSVRTFRLTGQDFIQEFYRDFSCSRCRASNTVQNHRERVYHTSEQVTNSLLENQMHARDQLCRNGCWECSNLEFRF